MLEKTEYYYDFLKYYERAKILNLRNIGKLPGDTDCGDELQQNVTIYDTVWRRYAGFSKVLEQLWYGYESWTQRKSDISCKDIMTIHQWLYICLVHRLTGSGASFEKDHGYRNTLLIDMIENGPITMDYWRDYIKNYDKPFFTSKGNQIPPFNKPSKGWDKGGREFICDIAPNLSYYMTKIIQEKYLDKDREAKIHFYEKDSMYVGTIPIKVKKPIQPIIDVALDWLTANGFKRYKFVVTAWVMDMAEYYPHLVDPTSHCYYGANCIRSFELMFKGIKKKQYDEAMELLCKEVENDQPMSVEDVACDFIRYVNNYIPKNYDKLYKRLPLRGEK